MRSGKVQKLPLEERLGGGNHRGGVAASLPLRETQKDEMHALVGLVPLGSKYPRAMGENIGSGEEGGTRRQTRSIQTFTIAGPRTLHIKRDKK